MIAGAGPLAGVFRVLALLCAIWLSPAAALAADAPARKVALVIGNSAYKNLNALTNPSNDARLIAKTLKGLGFELVGGDARVDLDKAGFDRAVQQFGAALQNADVGLFYYAGHGLQVQGANWLVPTSANPTGPQDLDFQMIDANLVLKQMQFAQTRLNIVILDACRNNPFGGRGLRAAGGGLAEMRAPQGTLIAYATQPDSVARDGAGANSPFTTALARTLVEPGLDLFRLFNQVGLAVKRETGGDQQPWVSSSPIEGDFFFSPAGKGDAPAPHADADLAFWQAVANSNDPADFRSYLAQFPDGRYADLARRRAQPPAADQPSAAARADQPAPPPAAAAPAETPSMMSRLAMLLHPPSRPSPAKPAPGEQGQSEAAPPLYVAAADALDKIARGFEGSYVSYIDSYHPEYVNGYGADTRKFDDNDLETLRTLRQSLAHAGDGPAGGFAYVEITEPIVLPPGAAAHPEPPPLPTAVQNFLDAADALRPRLDEATLYYDQKNYRDDKFAQGKAMHPGIMAAYGAFLAADAALTEALRRLSAGERQTYLNHLADADRPIKAGVLQNVAQARQLVQFIASSLDANHGDARNIDLTRLKSEIDLYERSLSQLRSYTGGDTGGGGNLKAVGLKIRTDSYFRYADELLTASRYLWRAVRDKETLEYHYFSFRNGTEYDILVRLNRVIESANALSR